MPRARRSKNKGRPINRIIKEALASIDIDEEEQVLTLRCLGITIDFASARHLATFLQKHPNAVNKLHLIGGWFTEKALEHLQAYLSTANLDSIRLAALDSDTYEGLLSGLHSNPFVTELGVADGPVAGGVISTLMKNNSTLTTLAFGFKHPNAYIPLGLEGARALQPGLRANKTVKCLGLIGCELGDDGLCLLVDALQDNTTIKFLVLENNQFTSNGLPHVTRLLENESLSLNHINLGDNPGLLNNREKTKRFATALSHCARMTGIRMNFCQLPSHAFVSLLQAAAAARSTTLQELCVYDHAQLKQASLKRILEILPAVHLESLRINLNLDNERVISSFHRNLNIQRLFSGAEDMDEITEGPVFDSLSRNRVLYNDVRLAVQAIKLDEEGQELKVACGRHNFPIDDVNAQCIADFLRPLPRSTVKRLDLDFRWFTPGAVENLRAYFTESTLHEISLQGDLLENRNAIRLLSGLHHNASINHLTLRRVGIGGDTVSTLLQNIPRLTLLFCSDLRLGVEGARAMQQGIRGNATVTSLTLDSCQLEDAGLLALVEALEENTTITVLSLNDNGFTANSLPHVTRLIQHHESSLKTIHLERNPGLFDIEENTRLFSIALRNAKVVSMSFNFCRLPSHAVIAVFQAVAINKMVQVLRVYDSVQIHDGSDLDGVLAIVSNMKYLQTLHVNLDFEDKSVLSSFHWNTSLRHLYDSHDAEITNGPVFEILKRNRRLRDAIGLLDNERRRTAPFLGLWSNAIEQLDGENAAAGATAVYKIMQEKLVMWCAPETSSSTANTTTFATATAAAASSLPSSRREEREINQDESASENAEPEPKRQRFL